MLVLEIIKSLGDINRLRIINILNVRELCVCEIENILELKQSSISQHCIRLKYGQLIESTKKSQWVFYRLNLSTIENYPFLKAFIKDLPQYAKIFNEDIERMEKLGFENDLCYNSKAYEAGVK